MRRDLIIGIAVSLLVHGGVVYFGEILGHRKHLPPPQQKLPAIQIIEMPPIQPETQEVPNPDQQQAPQDFAPPMQADIPQMTADTTFVQQLQPPPPADMQINRSAIVIPKNSGNWVKGLGEIFDISKLDQIPVATVQVQPQYPFEMRRAGITGTVIVNFIVDTNGNVHDAYAASSTQRDFEQSAVTAVSHWKFRPGRKGGRAVNSRMQVPIVFRLDNND
ncbi:MAG: TonB family protein [Opitutaceae bacterium]